MENLIQKTGVDEEKLCQWGNGKTPSMSRWQLIVTREFCFLVPG